MQDFDTKDMKIHEEHEESVNFGLVAPFFVFFVFFVVQSLASAAYSGNSVKCSAAS